MSGQQPVTTGRGRISADVQPEVRLRCGCDVSRLPADAPTEFGVVYAASRARLVGQLTAVTGSFAEAEELVQDAFAKAFVRWSRVGRLDNPELWVRQVAFRAAINRWRHLRIVQRHRPRTALAPEPSGDTVDLIRALRQLRPTQRAVLVLHYVADLSIEEIAGQLGRPTGTVKAQLSRGRRSLAALLREEEVNDVRA